MEKDELPADVLRFVDENVDSVPHLEALLILWENPEESFAVADLAARLYVPADVAARIAHDLTQRRLARAVAESRYQFDTAGDPGGELTARVSATYRRHLVPIANRIHSKASASVRAFAQAFDLKKDD
jgi:hypothetical protein